MSAASFMCRGLALLFAYLLPVLFIINKAEAQWWKEERIRADIKLTKKQTAEIDKIFEESWKKREAGSTNIRKSIEELNVLMKGEDIDEKKVSQAVDGLVALQSQNFREIVSMKMKIRKLLSKEQLKTLNEKYPDILSPSSRWAAGDRTRRGQRDGQAKKGKND